MKKLLILSLILFISGCTGYQYILEEERTHSYTEDHPLTKDNAYDVCMEWLAKNYRSANTVIQLKEKGSGKIIMQAVGAYTFDLLGTMQMEYDYTLSIKLADKKIKYEFIINNIRGSSYLPYKKDLPQIQKYFDNIRHGIQDALHNYKEDAF